ncbi:MAG TPA: hypothetical protein VE978_08835 [Chitinophagales bacterium]|nr:hypothetical protein [Chitinophagales bacterium]
MNLSHYPFVANVEFIDFEFVSEGPKGHILKVVRFTELEKDLFNLGFGDKDLITGYVDDQVVSNNRDEKKIFATIASITQLFLERFPTVSITGKGSTQSRTRLYKIQLSINLELIRNDFLLFGLVDDRWEEFDKDHQYQAFLVRRK